jgi:hypothetical protein
VGGAGVAAGAEAEAEAEAEAAFRGTAPGARFATCPY